MNWKRIIPFLLLISLTLSVWPQQVSFTPVFLNSCYPDSIEESKSKYISEINSDFTARDHLFYYRGNPKYKDVYWFNNDSVILPDTGIYKYYVWGIYDPLWIYVDNKGFNTDTFYSHRIEFKEYEMTGRYRYMVCNELANGKQTGYYYDGKLRLTSTFKDGLPIDTLIYYHNSNGAVSDIRYKIKRGYREYRYDFQGNITYQYEYDKNIFTSIGVEKRFKNDSLLGIDTFKRVKFLCEQSYKYNDDSSLISKQVGNKKLEQFISTKKTLLLKRRRMYLQGKYFHEKGTARAHDYMYKVKLYNNEEGCILKIKYINRGEIANQMDENIFGAYTSFIKLKGFVAGSKAYKIDEKWNKEAHKFQYIKKIKKSPFWKFDSYVTIENIDEIVKTKTIQSPF